MSKYSELGFPEPEELPINPETGYAIPPDGVTVSANGAGYVTGHRGVFYPSGTFSENTNAFNTETAIQAQETRRELKELRVREAVEKRMNKPFVEAYGEAAGVFWDEIVLNPDTSGRTRMDVWKAIGEEAGLVDKSSDGGGSGADLNLRNLTPQHITELRKLVEVLVETPPTIDGEFVD